MKTFNYDEVMEQNYHMMDTDGEFIRPMTYEEIAHYLYYKQQLLDEEWYNTVGGNVS